jgi:hypothetical protein
MIYFLQSPDGGPVKIGHTVNLDVRRQQLESYYRQPLALLATREGGRAEERAIHERFAEHRLGRTEQFRPVAEIMAFIGRPLLVGADPDAVEAMVGLESRVRSAITNIRSTPEWKEWLVRFSDHVRKDATDAVDEALLRYARAEGFELPPKR